MCKCTAEMDKGFVGLELLLAALALKGNDRQGIRPGRTKLQASQSSFTVGLGNANCSISTLHCKELSWHSSQQLKEECFHLGYPGFLLSAPGGQGMKEWQHHSNSSWCPLVNALVERDDWDFGLLLWAKPGLLPKSTAEQLTAQVVGSRLGE